MNSRSLNNVAALALALLAACFAFTLGSYTYPECSENGKGCCDFGPGSMKNRGYIVVQISGDDMVVTCSNSVLRCSYENPNQVANDEGQTNITCPDFNTLMESRSEFTYLDGVAAKPSTTAPSTTSEEDDESGAGTVTAANY